MGQRALACLGGQMKLEPKVAQVTLPPFQTAHGNVTSYRYDRDSPLKTLPLEGLS